MKKLYEHCTYLDCTGKHVGHGYCKLHYERFMSSGNPAGTDATAVRGLSVVDHFQYFYARSKATTAGCIEWAGSKDQGGYGRLQKEGKTYKAHRVSYGVNIGDIPSNNEICHTCDNPSCVNPDHLFAGTTKDNATDRESKGRGNHKANEVKYDLLSPEGIRFNGFGLTALAKEKGLQQPKLSEVMAGSRKNHKGWTQYV